MYNVWAGFPPFPGQTWVEFGQGRTLVGLDAGDPDFDTIGEVGGTKTPFKKAEKIYFYTKCVLWLP
jgi:hypothetical protein